MNHENNMKKLILLGAGIFISLAPFVGTVYANTTATSSTASLIAQLQAQLQTLQVQISALIAAQTQVNQTQTGINNTARLLHSLRQGMSGDDVKALQALLASDASIYPEGIISGFFGKLTGQAVRRFQNKHGLLSVGNVGTSTISELNKLSEENGLKFEDSDHGRKLCSSVAPGHLIAPGWLRKNHTSENEQENLIPSCQTLPPGIINHDGGEGNSAFTVADTIPPIINNLIATSTTAVSAHIIWNTNEPAKSAVWYATSTPVSTSPHTSRQLLTALTLNHEVILGGLTPSTTYYYLAASADAAGNNATSTQSSFTTK